MCFQTVLGVKGVLENPIINNIAQIKLIVNNEVLKANISNQQTSATFTSSNGVLRAQANSVGSLVTGDSAPNQNQYTPIYVNNAKTWKLVKASTYNSYDTERRIFVNGVNDIKITSSGLSSSLGIWGSFLKLEGEIERTLSNMIQPVQTSQQLILSGQESLISGQIIQNKGSLETSSVRGNLDRRLTSQVIVFKVAASWLGVVVETGKPELSKLTCETFKSGDDGFINGVVKNIGDGKGTFELSVSDCTPFQQRFGGVTNRLTLLPGEKSDFSVVLSTDNVATDISKECTLTVTDVGFSSIKDSAKISCSLTQPALCKAGDNKVAGNCVFKCREDERGFDEQFCCKTIPHINSTNNNYECVTPEEVIEESTKNFEDTILLPKEEIKLDCSSFETEYIKLTKDYGPFYWRAYTPGIDPVIIETPDCKPAGWIWIVVGGIVITVLGTVLILQLTNIRKKSTNKQK